MLDTNIISYIIKNRDFSLIDKFEKISKEHIIAISSITFERIEDLKIEDWTKQECY